MIYCTIIFYIVHYIVGTNTLQSTIMSYSIAAPSMTG